VIDLLTNSSVSEWLDRQTDRQNTKLTGRATRQDDLSSLSGWQSRRARLSSCLAGGPFSSHGMSCVVMCQIHVFEESKKIIFRLGIFRRRRAFGNRQQIIHP